MTGDIEAHWDARTRMLWGSRRVFYQLLNASGFNSTIQTAFIERVNLTIRRGVAPLMRKTCLSLCRPNTCSVTLSGGERLRQVFSY